MAINSLFYNEIRRHHLFKCLSDASFKTILQHSGIVSLTKNEALFECCFEANHFFMVRSGQITLFQTSSDGNEKIIDILEARRTFAEEVMFIDDQCYSVNARAACDTELFYFDVHSFKAQLQQSNELCFSMMLEMSNRLKTQTQEIIELSIHDAQYRLVHYLLQKSCNKNVKPCPPVVILSTTKSLLASRLSITPETFSRILTRLKKQDLISIKEDAITLNDPEKLADLVGFHGSQIALKPKKSERHWSKIKENSVLSA